MGHSTHFTGEEPVDDAPSGYSQVLPLTYLPEDYDGVPQDGAEYLAAMQAQAHSLPWGTIAKEWYRPIDSPESGSESTTNATAGPSKVKIRHPALPTESWIVSFDAHFVAYREYIQSLHPPHLTPDQLKVARESNYETWYAYINGAKRKKIYKKFDPEVEVEAVPESVSVPGGVVHAVREVSGEDMDLDEEAAMNGSFGVIEKDVEITVQRTTVDAEPAVTKSTTDTSLDPEETEYDEDWIEDDSDSSSSSISDERPLSNHPTLPTPVIDEEEEAMNAPPPPPPRPKGYQELEPEMERHKAHEPLLRFVKGLSQHRQIWLIEAFTKWLTASLALHTDPPILITTQPTSSSNHSTASNQDGMYTLATPPVDHHPLPAHWAKWIFVLLCCIPRELSGDDTFALREVAKICRDVVRWQVDSGVLESEAETDGDDFVGGEEDEREKERREAHEAMRRDCWMIHQAVIAGWAQKDMGMDAEQIFAKMAARASGV